MNQQLIGSLGRAPPGDAADAPGTGALLWRVALLSLTALALVFLLLYWQAAAHAVEAWYASRSYNHGFLVIPVVAYLIWERRAMLEGLAPAPRAAPLLFLLPIGAAWLVAHLIGIMEGQQLALFLAIQVIALAVLGRPIYRALAFPFLYLFFLVPTGDFLVPYLQNFTARFVVEGIRLSGVPVYLDGVFISIPTGNFEVAEACAGLRFLTATVAYGVLFADFAYSSWRRKLAFYALCLATPLIANGLRAYGIVMIAYLTDNRLATGVDHIVYGWLFFSLVTIVLTAIGMSFRDLPRRAPRGEIDGGGAGSIRALVAVAGLAGLLLTLPRAYAAYIDARPGPSLARDIAPSVTAPWLRSPETGKSWRPLLVGADRAMLARYERNGAAVDLYVGYLAKQTNGRKLVSTGNRLSDAPGWTSASWTTIPVTIAGERVKATAITVISGKRRRLVLSWYWIDKRLVAGTIAAKLLQARAELLDGWLPAAAVAISTEIGEDGGDRAARANLVDFARHLDHLPAQLAAVAGR